MTGPEGLSGFTRALILRLVLSGERAAVALRWASGGASACAPPLLGAPPHPGAVAHATLSLPLHTTVRALLTDHRPPGTCQILSHSFLVSQVSNSNI